MSAPDAFLPNPGALVGAIGEPIMLRAYTANPRAFLVGESTKDLPVDVAGWLRQLQTEIPELTSFSAEVVYDDARRIAFPTQALRPILRAARHAAATAPSGKGAIIITATQRRSGIAVGCNLKTDSASGGSLLILPHMKELFAALNSWLGMTVNIVIRFTFPMLSAHERLAFSAESNPAIADHDLTS